MGAKSNFEMIREVRKVLNVSFNDDALIPQIQPELFDRMIVAFSLDHYTATMDIAVDFNWGEE